MDWLWIAALIWTALALPLAVVTGIYLRRSDQHAAREHSSNAGRRPELPPASSPVEPPSPRRARRPGRSATPRGVQRATAHRCGIRRTMSPPGRRGATTPPAEPDDPTADWPRSRSPLYRHR